MNKEKAIAVETIPVIFRKDRDGVVAVFPTIPAGLGGYDMACYAHIGSHAACNYSWYNKTSSVKPDEYTELLEEVKEIYEKDEYDENPVTLIIYKKIQPWMREERKKKSKLWWGKVMDAMNEVGK